MKMIRRLGLAGLAGRVIGWCRSAGREFRTGTNWTAVLAALGLFLLAWGLYLVAGRGWTLIAMGLIFLGVAMVDAADRTANRRGDE